MQATAKRMQTNGTVLSILLGTYLAGMFGILGRTINEITANDVARTIVLAILGGVIGWLTNITLTYIKKKITKRK
jgi:hypothetical protein